MRPSTVQTVAPAKLPVNLDEAATYLRADAPELKQEVRRLLEAATVYAQEYQWSQLITATFEDRYDCFPRCIELQKSPVQSVTSITYVDTAGTTQTLTANTDYTVDIYHKPCRIVPAYARWWPITRHHINDVVVTYVAGYGDNPEDVPDNIRQAIWMLAGFWEVNHEAAMVSLPKQVEFTTKALLDLNSFRTFY